MNEREITVEQLRHLLFGVWDQGVEVGQLRHLLFGLDDQRESAIVALERLSAQSSQS